MPAHERATSPVTMETWHDMDPTQRSVLGGGALTTDEVVGPSMGARLSMPGRPYEGPEGGEPTRQPGSGDWTDPAHGAGQVWPLGVKSEPWARPGQPGGKPPRHQTRAYRRHRLT